MLRKVDSGYAFRVELLRRWVAQNKPLPRVRDELDRIVPFAETLYRDGEGWYQQRDLENAESQLRQALYVNPNHLKARLLLGQVLMEQERPDDAIEELEQAYQYDENATRHALVRALLDKAQRLERDNQQDAALALYERVLTFSPREKVARERHDAIWIATGDKLLKRDDFDGAIQAYEKANAESKMQQVRERQRQLQYEHLAQAARQHEQKEEWEQALQFYQQLTNEFPNETRWGEAITRVQMELELSGRYAEGLGAFKQGNWAQAQRALANTVYARPDYKDAAELLAQAVSKARHAKFLQHTPAQQQVVRPPARKRKAKNTYQRKKNIRNIIAPNYFEWSAIQTILLAFIPCHPIHTDWNTPKRR
jgi:tetratricopeptide (TPR) repeat protein